jgi:hypothetical protein
VLDGRLDLAIDCGDKDAGGVGSVFPLDEADAVLASSWGRLPPSEKSFYLLRSFCVEGPCLSDTIGI